MTAAQSTHGPPVPSLDVLTAVADRHRARFAEAVARLDVTAVRRLIGAVRDLRDRGSTLYIAGNGGSAATATHWANDLGKGAKVARGRRPIKVLSLSDNISWFSALANDEGYENVFSGQLANFAEVDDLLVVISASGNSPNLLEAVRMATSRGVRTIGLLGFDGGQLLALVGDHILVPTQHGEYALVETAHMLVADMVTVALAADHTP